MSSVVRFMTRPVARGWFRQFARNADKKFLKNVFSGKYRFGRMARFRMTRRPMGLGMFRKKRYNRRRIGYKRKTQNKVHNFVRWCDKDTQYPDSSGPSSIVETGVDQNLVYSFKLDNLVNPSDFTNLFDRYRINKVTLVLTRMRNSTGDGSASPYNRKIAVVWDDDANPLTQEDNYLEYGNCKRYSIVGNGDIRLTLYPKISAPLLNAGGSNNAYQTIPSSKQWLKIEDDDVPHFGLKIFVPAGIAPVDYGLFIVRAKFHMSFKNSK